MPPDDEEVPDAKYHQSFRPFSFEEGLAYLRDENASGFRSIHFAEGYDGPDLCLPTDIPDDDAWVFSSVRGVFVRVHRRPRSSSYAPDVMQAAFEATAICGARFATLCTSIRTFPDGTSDVVTYDYITETATGDTELPWRGVTYFCLEEFLESFLEFSSSLGAKVEATPVTAAARRSGAPPSSYIDDPVDHNEGNEPWMLDSGTTFHIISQDTVDKRGYKMVQLSKPISFNTANGQTWASNVAEFDLPGADQPLHAFVLPTCAP
jgi:hypothetical protein